jgi:predicted amidophosphoribosyltransferase
VFPLGEHAGDLRRAISGYKYRGQRWLADVFASMVGGYLDEHATWFEEFGVITSVPSFVGAGAGRDWDPTGLILDRLVRYAPPGWLVAPHVLAKVRTTPRMQGRSWTERQLIARGPLRHALVVRDSRAVAGQRVLVLDDVLTEGSTMREVALQLIGAGASEVAGLVLARPGWGDRPIV